MKSLHSFSRSESEIETARDQEQEVNMKKKILENSQETRISLVSGHYIDTDTIKSPKFSVLIFTFLFFLTLRVTIKVVAVKQNTQHLDVNI